MDGKTGKIMPVPEVKLYNHICLGSIFVGKCAKTEEILDRNGSQRCRWYAVVWRFSGILLQLGAKRAFLRMAGSGWRLRWSLRDRRMERRGMFRKTSVYLQDESANGRAGLFYVFRLTFSVQLYWHCRGRQSAMRLSGNNCLRMRICGKVLLQWRRCIWHFLLSSQRKEVIFSKIKRSDPSKKI